MTVNTREWPLEVRHHHVYEVNANQIALLHEDLNGDSHAARDMTEDIEGRDRK